MAGDWIKIEHVTPDKPEVVMMAAKLDIDQDAITGKLLRIWIWADQNTVNGNAVSVTNSFLDRLVFCNGFAEALHSVGWISGENGALTFPNFGSHNGKTAKTRADTNRRVAQHRKDSQQCNKKTVTKDEQKPLPEKRREEKSIKSLSALLWDGSPAQGRNRSSRKKVEAEFKKIKVTDRPTVDELNAAIKAWANSDGWTKDGGEFVPGIHIFIKDRKWESLPEKTNNPKVNGNRPDRNTGTANAGNTTDWSQYEK